MNQFTVSESIYVLLKWNGKHGFTSNLWMLNVESSVIDKSFPQNI